MMSIHRISLLGLLTAALLASPLRAAEPKDIDKAIQNGVAYLKSIQDRNGTWNYNAFGEAGSGATIGATALGALTLMECDVPPDDEHIQKAAKAIREGSINLNHTYSISLSILFLDRLGDKEDVPLIESLAVRLLAGQNRGSGAWTYQCPVPDPRDLTRLRTILKDRDEKTPAKKDKPDSEDDKPLRDKRDSEGKQQGRRVSKEIEAQIEAMQRASLAPIAPAVIGMAEGDNSNTQFAILALWVARRHDLPVDEALTRVEARFRKTQNADGGWSYRSRMTGPAMDVGGFSDSTPSMTCAGLLGLAAGYGANATVLKTADPKKDKDKEKKDKDAKDGPPKKEPTPRDLNKDVHIKAGLKALGSTLGNPAAKGQRAALTPALARGGIQRSLYYTLWSVERVAVAYDLDTIGNKDWYGWGSDVILATQKNDGSWTADFSGNVDTSFALLFLRRANLARDLTTVLKGRVHDPDLKAGPGKNDADTKPEPKEEIKPKPESKPLETIKEKPEVPKPPPASAETDAGRMGKELMQANPAKQERALDGLRAGKGADYTQVLLKAIPKLEGDIKKKAREALAERMSRMTSATLSDRLQDDDSEMRRAAALAVAMKEDTAHIPRLIELLDDSETSVSRAAYAALKSLSGKDFGPPKDADRAQRADAVAAWKKWWKEKGGK